MDFRQLEVFAATVEHQSFSAAADAIYLSQPTVSAHIKSLEKELQTQLIRRTKKTFEVTADGKRLYDYAVTILHLQQKALSELSAINAHELHIGASSVPGQCILPELLADFQQNNPEVSFHITYDQSLEIIRQVENGSLDLGLVGMVTDADCVFEPIASDELVIVTPNTPYFRQLKEKGVGIPELLKERVILRTESSGTKQEMEQVLQKLKMKDENLKVAAHMNDASALMRSVSLGLGISIVSRLVAEEPANRGALLIFDLGKYRQTRKFYLVYQENRYFSKVTEAFLAHLRKAKPAELD